MLLAEVPAFELWNDTLFKEAAIQPVAFITGGTSGIGLETAVQLLAAGWRVAVCGRDATRVGEAERTLRGNADRDDVMALSCDVADRHEGQAIIEGVLAVWGRVDAFVHSAGLAPRLPLSQHDDELISKVFETNTLSALRLVRGLWPGFERQRGGTVVLVSSMASREPYPGFFAYAASKAALNLAAVSIAQEGAACGVRAFAVAPGAVETPMLRAIADEAMVPRNKALSPSAVALVIVQCILGVHDAYNGQTIFIPSPV